MPGQNTDQPALFEATELAGRPEEVTATPKMSGHSLRLDLAGSFAGKPRRKEAVRFQAVSPFVNLPLHEVCAFCGAEVRAPGFVIPDYEELGVFCKEECGDKRFRLYLNDRGDEERGLDDVDQCPA